MAQPTDPTFGSDFDPNAFRQAILSVMEMGTPTEPAMKVIFQWDSQASYAVPVDGSGRPFDLHAQPTSVNSHEPVQALCGVKWIEKAPTGTPIGQFDNPRVEVSMLDVEYEKVRGASKMSIGGNLYHIDYVTQSALFTVDSYTIHATAGDET